MNIRNYKSLAWLIIAVMLFGLMPAIATAEAEENGNSDPTEVLYLVDDVVGTSDPSILYKVELVGGTTPKAVLTESKELTGFNECQAIACDPDDPQHLIYAIDRGSGIATLGVYNVYNDYWENLGHITTSPGSLNITAVVLAAFSPDGRLFIGCQESDEIYEVNTDTLKATSYGKLMVGTTSLVLAGGDFAFDSDGNLYTWKNSGSLYFTSYGAFEPGNMATEHRGGATDYFTGLAIRENGSGDLVGSKTNPSNEIVVINKTNGAPIDNYPMYLSTDLENIHPYNYGDMTAGPIFKYVICGHKYESEDGSLTTSSGLAGWEILLEKEDTTSPGSWIEQYSIFTTTGGSYCFEDLIAGTYRISEKQKSGWNQIFPENGGYHEVVLGPDYQESYYNFWNQMKTYDICGNKYEIAPDQTITSGTGWEIYFEMTSDASLIATGSAVTDAEGHYCFEDLDAGHYKIFEENRTGWDVVTPSAGFYEFDLNECTAGQSYDFYNIEELEKHCVATETAWAAEHTTEGGTRFTTQGSWATYIQYPQTSEAASENNPNIYPLYAGQHYPAGYLEVWDEDNYLNVKYNANLCDGFLATHDLDEKDIPTPGEVCEGEWEFLELHLQIADDADGLLEKSNGNGPPLHSHGKLNPKIKTHEPKNPAPGQFDNKYTPGEPFTDYTFEIDDNFDGNICIAAHAVMRYCGYECTEPDQ